jgi:hypothetical protein
MGTNILEEPSSVKKRQLFFTEDGDSKFLQNIATYTCNLHGDISHKTIILCLPILWKSIILPHL